MVLKQIEIQGFKSFPDKMTIPFDDGVTAIVGPNGSGKSNIADAVLWVLGEQSAKNLRGERMEDVIFSGTDKRSPLGFAQVTLVIDNRSQLLAVAADEVRVSRRVYRSGECEYSINDASCRLKDITELFLDTGVGRDGYALIGQGKIDSILSARPDERRQIFEEAAGISRHRHKKQEAERKLKATDENLVRITDIVLELEKQVGPLYRQQKKAKEYLEQKENLKALEVSVALSDIERIKAQQAEGAESLHHKEAELTAAREALEAQKAQQSRLFDQMGAGDQQTEALRGEVLRLTRAAADARQEAALIEREAAYKRQEAERTQQQGAALRDRRVAQMSELTGAQSKYDAILKLRDDASHQSAQAEQEYIRLTESTAQSDGELTTMQQELFQLQQQLRGVERERMDLSAQEAAQTELAQTLEEEIASAERERVDRIRQENEAQEQYQLLQSDSAHQSETLHAWEQEISVVKKAVQDALSARGELAAQLRQTEDRIRLYTDLQNEMDGFGISVKKVMEASSKKELRGGKIYGPLGSLLLAQSRFATAIEVALGAHSQSIVTQDETAAKSAIDFLKKNRLGRATFLPLDAVKRPQDLRLEVQLRGEPGFLGMAGNLVDFEETYRAAVEFALSRTLVVDTLDHALALARKHHHRLRIVTLDGELLSPGGSVAGGRSRGKSAGVIGRKAQLDELTRQKKPLEGALADAEKKLHRLQEETRQKEGAFQTLLAASDAAQTKLREGQNRLEHCRLVLSALDADLSAKRAARDEAFSRAEVLHTRYETTEARQQELHSQADRLEKQLSERRESTQAILKQREELDRERLRQKLVLESFEKDLAAAYDKKRALEEEVLSLEEQAEKAKCHTADLLEEAEELESDVDFKQRQAEELVEECHQREAEISTLQEQKSSANEEIAAIRKEIDLLTERLLSRQKERDAQATLSQQLDNELEGVYNRLWEDYELTYSSALELRQSLEGLDIARAKISKIKSLLKSFGSVNVDAIEQYKEVKERYDFLSAQKEDLTKASQSLRGMIAEVTQVMQKQFQDNFARIAKRFSEVFADLFDGGRGELSLSDPEHVLESPVEIVVQPKGKRLQSISLLSGGEKALAAIAVVFAILSVRPTPFCIFDEIEAALDDVNVYRFADYFRRYAKTTQFIVITHRRGTMEAADTLFGVTMQEKGVSALLPLKLSDIA